MNGGFLTEWLNGHLSGNTNTFHTSEYLSSTSSCIKTWPKMSYNISIHSYSSGQKVFIGSYSHPTILQMKNKVFDYLSKYLLIRPKPHFQILLPKSLLFLWWSQYPKNTLCSALSLGILAFAILYGNSILTSFHPVQILPILHGPWLCLTWGPHSLICLIEDLNNI